MEGFSPEATGRDFRFSGGVESLSCGIRRNVTHDLRVKTLLGPAVAVLSVVAALWLHSGLKSRTLAGVQVSPDVHLSAHAKESGDRRVVAVPTRIVYLHKRALWQDPFAAIILVAGLGAAATMIRHRRAT